MLKACDFSLSARITFAREKAVNICKIQLFCWKCIFHEWINTKLRNCFLSCEYFFFSSSSFFRIALPIINIVATTTTRAVMPPCQRRLTCVLSVVCQNSKQVEVVHPLLIVRHNGWHRILEYKSYFMNELNSNQILITNYKIELLVCMWCV